MQYPIQSRDGNSRDVFISHASEDKEPFVRRLVDALMKQGISVWFDEFELQIGDSLRQKIDEGLRRSRYALVIFSPTFFEKHWTQYEMDGLIARQMSGTERVILPIWRGLSREEIAQQSLSLTDICAGDTSIDSLETIASKVANKVKGITPSRPSLQSATQSDSVGRTFGVFYIAPSGTKELPLGPVAKNPIGSPHYMEGWISMVASDQELEYIIEGTTLRVQLNWGHSQLGDEIFAMNMVDKGEPFALTIRTSTGSQLYFPLVENTNPRNRRRGYSNPSGWMVFNIR